MFRLGLDIHCSQTHLPLTDPTCILLPPRRPFSTISDTLGNKITISLSTRYNKPASTIREYFSVQNVQQWGRVRRLDGGDDMYASALCRSAEDKRDATFIRVSVIIILFNPSRNTVLRVPFD